MSPRDTSAFQNQKARSVKHSAKRHYFTWKQPRPEMLNGRLRTALNCWRRTTGIRGGEIKRLRLGMVNIGARRIRITRKSTKTDAGARWVELNACALSPASRLYQRAQLLGASTADHFLLPADLSRHTKNTDPLKGRRGFDPTMHQMSWDTAWRNLRKAAGLHKLRFHSMRHTFITRLAEIGVPLEVTQSAVGHMSAAITRHYRHISDNVARAAVEKLDAIRKVPRFVDVFVDMPEEAKPKLLN